jgi:hypothetical protein
MCRKERDSTVGQGMAGECSLSQRRHRARPTYRDPALSPVEATVRGRNGALRRKEQG